EVKQQPSTGTPPACPQGRSCQGHTHPRRTEDRQTQTQRQDWQRSLSDSKQQSRRAPQLGQTQQWTQKKGQSGTKYGRRRAATPEPAESPVPESTAPAAAPTPGSSAPVAAPTPGSPAPAAAPTLDSTAPAAVPAPGSSAPAAAPTPGSTAPAPAPAPGSSAPAVVPGAPGSVTPGAPLRRVQRRSYHTRIWSREGSSRRGGEAPAPAERPAPEVPLLRLQYWKYHSRSCAEERAPPCYSLEST
ncbi:unnamed protein product, partial [Closterium sp. NIES-54]